MVISSLAKEILAVSDTVYAVPGYPVTELIEETGAELVINEKVALEYALGDSLSGKRSCVIIKHVGMNALADPLVHASFQGLKAGVVIISGDDPVAKNTLTVQNSLSYGQIAVIPALDADSSDACRINEAFLLSEQFSRVCLVRFSPESMAGYASSLSCPDTRGTGSLADSDLTMYGRALEAYDPVPLMQKRGLLSDIIRPEELLHPSLQFPRRRSERGYARTLCKACPFHTLFILLKDSGYQVICDTGCSLLAMNPPYNFGIACFGMGSSVGVGSKSTGIVLTGDQALFHSGLQALIDIREKGQSLLCLVMQNMCMGMTGGQPTPDIIPYLQAFDPVICDAGDEASLSELIKIPEKLRVVVVQGLCPQVIHHEIVEC